MDGTETFIVMHSMWSAKLGTFLAYEDPLLLVRLIELSSTEEGISPSELQKAFIIKQSRLSKLLKKLRAGKWITVRKSSADRRVKLVTATDRAKKVMSRLQSELSAVLMEPAQAVPGRGKGPKLAKGQTSLFTG